MYMSKWDYLVYNRGEHQSNVSTGIPKELNGQVESTVIYESGGGEGAENIASGVTVILSHTQLGETAAVTSDAYLKITTDDL